ncbi:MAG: nucleoside deaminase [Candidatus Paceibacterota bacterium]
MKNENVDKQYIRECISIASVGTQYGEFPFGALVLFDGKVISKRHNESLHKKEVYRHAEMLALLDAQEILTPVELSRSTLYSSVEPCPMCSFAIQELNIGRVVFGLRSPVMGGYTKWPVLQDRQINDIFPKSFGRPPEIVPGILKSEVVRGWRLWNEGKWLKFIAKGVFVE